MAKKDDMNVKIEGRLGFLAELPQGAEVPTEFQVFPFGRVEIQGENPFTVDQAAIEDVIRKFEARGLDMVIDFEHQTEGGEWSSPDGTAPAAGWVKRLVNKGEQGLWAVVEWTERAAEYLASREYRYFSPVFLVSKGDRKLLELLRVALTNAPRLNWIRPIVAKTGNEPPREGHFTEDAMEMLKTIAKALGLAEDATQDQVRAEIAKLREPPQPVVAKSVVSALGLAETATESEVVATIHAIRQRPDLSTEVAALKTRLAERDRDDLVAAAMKEGKITPAQKEWALAYALSDPEGFKLFAAKAPAVITTRQLDIAPEGGGGQAGPALDDAQKQINKLMGVDEATWAKHNPKP